MQANSDRLARQQEMMNKVIQWLKAESYEPEERTHLRKDLNYFALVKVDQKKGFHIEFPATLLDSVIISEMIALDRNDQKAYVSLRPLEQNRFFFDLNLALLQMNVIFSVDKDARELQSLKVMKVIYFDGLTKDRFFDVIHTVGNAVEIAQFKFSQFRDSILPSHAGSSDEGNL